MKVVLINLFRKESQYLGEKWVKGVPLEICKMGTTVVLNKLCNWKTSKTASDEKGEAFVRQGVKKMGPVVTDNNNFIIDFQIKKAMNSGRTPQELESWLKSIPGILETGLFVDMASEAYFGQQDGSVSKRICKSPRVDTLS